jgi:hypothetical protein
VLVDAAQIIILLSHSWSNFKVLALARPCIIVSTFFSFHKLHSIIKIMVMNMVAMVKCRGRGLKERTNNPKIERLALVDHHHLYQHLGVVYHNP